MQQPDLFESPPWTAAVPRRTPRQKGEQAAKACADHAERVTEFDAEGAAKFIHGWVVRHGATSGEVLVDAAKAHGFRGHDDRCFGSVMAKLVRDCKLLVLRSDLPRKRGHGTSGGRLYGAVR